jgi:3-oxoacyl-[acyl-carrier protein] reductase
MGKLDNKIALVTGSSRGLGRAIAIKFASEGARIAINYNKDRKSAEELREKLPGSEIFQADVSNHNSVKNMVNEIHRKMGIIDILVNNAGILSAFSWDDFDDEKVKRIFDINLMGPIYTTKECIEDLRKQHGIIINMASNAGVGTAAKNTTFYSITKAGIAMLTKRLAFDLMNDHVRVNAIAPGWIESDMTIGNKSEEEINKLRDSFKSRTELNMTGKPENIADAALFLASSDSEYMDGQVIVVDGGRIDNLTHGL